MNLALRPGRGAAAGVSVALAGAGLLLTAAPAQAAACASTSSGVTVVVTNPSGGTSVRCSHGDPGSGAAALAGAGFAVTQVQTQPGFVCRIDGAPASDPCVRVPPTSAYWSYWYAQPGGSWTYSSAGAYGRDPAPGSVEGWAYGAGSPPSLAPPVVAAPAPAPKPSTSAPQPAPKPPPSTSAAPRPSSSSSGTGSSAAGPGSTGTTVQDDSAAADPTGSTSEVPTPAGTTTAPTGSPTTEPTRDGDESAVMPATPASALGPEAAGGSDPTSAAPTLAGLGVAGALLGAAGWMGWRRRSA